MRTTAGRWTLAITSIALFMTALDNLVVSTALPSIRRALGAGIESLEWTVNAYTLAFAVLLLTGAALGDRFGRRKMLGIGLGVFTGASAAAALAPGIDALIAARAIQGAGAAMVLPLTLTILSEAVRDNERGLAIGIWSGVSGLGVALGPLVGGLILNSGSWQLIFWVNVPIGLALTPLAFSRLAESKGPDDQLDIPGLLLAGAGLLGIVFGIVRGQASGWTSATILGSIGTGLVMLVAFIAWELRAEAPMLPMRFFRSRAFTAVNLASLTMFFGVFGSIFFLQQFFQTAQGLTPLQSGLRTLPWTLMPMFVAPLAGILSDRIGARPLMVAGLALQGGAIGWIAAVAAPHAAYITFVPAFVMGGVGMALVIAPSANAVLAAVPAELVGKASGAANAIRELGGVLGVAVLAAVFTAHGSYASPASYVHGMAAALPIGAAVLGLGAVAAAFIPARRAATGQRETGVAAVAAHTGAAA
ncbi:MAG: MFS transporter [Solirubrobacteraceae bacterium]